jgi:hypothetical protein
MAASQERIDDMTTGAHADFWSQVQLLAFSGVAGGVFRALISPEKRWRRRMVQVVAGAFSAIFLGGLAAGFIDGIVDAGVYSYLAAGFIMGSGGEAAVRAIQNKAFGKSDSP